MVTEFGMSELGPLAFGKKDEMVFLGREISEQRNYSDEIAFKIDQEVRQIVDRGHQRAMEIIQLHFGRLEAIARLLIREETIEDEELEMLFDSPRPKPDLVGPPTGRPSRIAQQTAAIVRNEPQPREEEDDDGGSFGSLTPQPV
jgi:cell division protease FtsH